jgi:hypothetical protein
MIDDLIIDRSIDDWCIASSMVHGFIDGLIDSVNERRVQRRHSVSMGSRRRSGGHGTAALTFGKSGASDRFVGSMGAG